MFNNNSKTNIENEQFVLERMKKSSNMYITLYPTSTMKVIYKKFKKTKSFLKKKKYHRQMTNEWCSMDVGVPPTEEEITNENLLADYVFRYYRHQFNDEINSDNNILLHEALEFMTLIRDRKEINEKRYMTLITALTQAGKTFAMIAIANIHLALSNVPMFIVKDIKQKTQFLSRYINDINMLKTWLKTKNFKDETIEIFDSPLYFDHKINTSKYTSYINNLQSALNGSRRRPILIISNLVHIERVKNLITPSSNLVIFIDEAHLLGGYKNISENGNGDDLHDSTCQYDSSLAELKTHTKKIFLITATPQDILMSEPNLYAYGVMWLPEGKSYRGIKDWSFNILNDKKYDTDVDTEIGGKKINIPQSFFDVMAELSTKEPLRRKNKFGIKDIHPINVLARFEHVNERQNMVLDCFKYGAKAVNTKHQKIIDVNWVVMTFNQYGVKLYHKSLCGETIKIGDHITKEIGLGEFLFPTAQIGEVWHWLWENGGVKRFPRMITIAYKSAEEGITFCSTWSNNPKTDANWHLTDGYMRLGSATASRSEQSSARGTGNHGDTFEKGVSIFTCHCSMDDKKKILKGYNLHYEQIQAICALARDKDDCRVIDYIRTIPVFSNHIPKKYYTIPSAISLLVKRKNPDQDIEEDSFKYHKSAVSTLQILSPDRYDGECQRERAKERVRGKKIDEKSNKLTGNIIKEPMNPGKNRDDYNSIIKYLNNNKNKWVPLTKIRRIFSSEKYNITLHDVKCTTYGEVGLMWRQLDGFGTSIDYVLV